MKAIKCFIILIGLICSIQVVAQDYGNQTICNLQMDTTGRVILRPCDQWATKNECSGGDGGWVEWYESEDQGGGKGMYSLALAAMMSDSTVMLRIDSSCSGQWDHLKAIRLYK